jgi:hypothetical protein
VSPAAACAASRCDELAISENFGRAGAIARRQVRNESGCGLKLVRRRDIDRLTVQQTTEASMATMEELPFTIEEWDAEGLHRLRIVARASNPAVGWAAYRETVAMRPQAHILFRHGIRVMAEHRGSDRRSGSAQPGTKA